MGNRRKAAGRGGRRQNDRRQDPFIRVRRNFWILVAATTVAVGMLSVALRQPPAPAVGLLTAVSGLMASITFTLAGRILVLASRGRRQRRR